MDNTDNDNIKLIYELRAKYRDECTNDIDEIIELFIKVRTKLVRGKLLSENDWKPIFELITKKVPDYDITLLQLFDESITTPE